MVAPQCRSSYEHAVPHVLSICKGEFNLFFESTENHRGLDHVPHLFVTTRVHHLPLIHQQGPTFDDDAKVML